MKAGDGFIALHNQAKGRTQSITQYVVDDILQNRNGSRLLMTVSARLVELRGLGNCPANLTALTGPASRWPIFYSSDFNAAVIWARVRPNWRDSAAGFTPALIEERIKLICDLVNCDKAGSGAP